MNSPTRRAFLATSAAGAIAATLASCHHDSAPQPLAEAPKEFHPKLKKALKYAAIQPGETPREKFEIIKSFGFVGVEIDTPNKLDRDAILKAANDTGMKVHGVIDSVHW